MNPNTITLDVREDLRRGSEPFSKIMQAVASLSEGKNLLLVAPFEPTPLYFVLGKQGFDHESKQTHSGDWEVLFKRREGDLKSFVPPEQPPCRAPKNEPAEIIDVDARGLEPPQPMVKILEAVAVAPEGAELRAHTDRRPMHIYAQLKERGFTGTTEEQKDGSFITSIRRR